MNRQNIQDYSDDYPALRAKLNTETDGGYRQFIAQLQPAYGRVLRDIGVGYAALATVLVLVSLPAAPEVQALGALAGAVMIGYAIAYLQLFLHEAAHSNLAPSRRLNDLLCDTLISWQTGTSVARYRPIHFGHHRALGQPEDSERSYFNALNWRFVAEMLLGIHALRVFSHREIDEGADRGVPVSLWPLLRGIVVHGALIWALVLANAWAAATAWVVGVGVFFPFFATLRQILEHRSEEAAPDTDFSQTPHGALTRMFGDGPVASTFGAAGFNRHLLHHWEPQVSYTRLADLEVYLLSTSAREIIEARRSTYGEALRGIWSAGR